METQTDHLLAAAPPPHTDRLSSHLHVVSRKTMLSSADMVLPLSCGVCLHLFYISLLLPTLIMYFNDYNQIQRHTNIHFEIYLISALIIHTLALITNILCTMIALGTKVLTTSKWLNILVSIRLFLTIFEIIIIIYGCMVFLIWNFNSKNTVLYTLIMINLLSNLILILSFWCILYYCCKSPTLNTTDIDESQRLCSSFLNKYCSLCFYDQQSRFDEMGGLITILMKGNPYDHLELTLSDTVTGLHLLRMLQKHYGLFDSNLCVPFNNLNENTQQNDERLNELRYYTLYANAAYGIGILSPSVLCCICCAMPCCLPNDIDDDILHRNDKCCNGVQIDNSNLKIFINRTETNVSDLLLIAQIGDVNKVNFYVNIDRIKHALVISLRGTMSIKDSVTDIECIPMHFPQIDDDCYVHRGIAKCAKYVFDIITNNEKILNFLKDNADYDIVICGHSLGAGVCVILSLMFKYGVGNDLFINKQRTFKAFAIAPPPVLEKKFALKISDEVSEYLTCFIYGYDVVPRITFNAVVFTRAAINRLLLECVKTPWWIYQKSLRITNDTIVNALKDDSKFINNYVNINNDDIMPGYDYFVNVVMNDVQNMKKTAIQHNLSVPELWSAQFCHIGYILHIVKDNMNEPQNVCNMFKCRMCSDEADTKYYIYRAHPEFCDKILISPYLVAHHMPQVYLNVIRNAN